MKKAKSEFDSLLNRMKNIKMKKFEIKKSNFNDPV